MWRPHYIIYGIMYFTLPTAYFADKRVCSPIHLSATEWQLDCPDRNLSSVPNYSDHPVVYLDLRNNSLNSSIVLSAWKSLKHVDLSFNNLTDIKNRTFEGIEALDKLVISYCSLLHITSQQLRGRMLVKYLDLSGNTLLPHSPDFLIVLNKSIDRGTHSINMNHLELSDFKFPDDFFFHAKHLRFFNLSSNGMEEFPRFPSRLNYLDISNNSVIILKKEPFRYSTEMIYLIVQNNPELVEIDEDAFRFMENLAKISLSGNKKLTFIPNDLFFYNHRLKYLSLVGCNFKTLSSYLEPQLMRLQMLELQGNPWKCDQSMQWLAGLNSSTLGLSHVRCADGSLFNEFFTVTKRNMLVILINVLVVMVFLFFFIGFWFVYDLEKKRKQSNPYWRLGKGANVVSPVYVSTVV